MIKVFNEKGNIVIVIERGKEWSHFSGSCGNREFIFGNAQGKYGYTSWRGQI